MVNTLQNEDQLTGNLELGATTLTGDLGNPNDSGGFVIAPSITNVQTINIAFTNTQSTFGEDSIDGYGQVGMTLDFQDIAGTDTANITRISANLRQKFTNLNGDVTTLGIADTAEQAKVTITYLNNELSGEDDSITLNLDNASLSNTQSEYDSTGAALKILATEARGSDLQHEIEAYNINTSGSASTIATFSTGVSDFDDLVVGERPVTINIDAEASLAVGTLRWLGNRIETNKANSFQTGFPVLAPLHQVGTNGLGFVDHSQINTITVTGSSNVTLANVGTWETENDLDESIDFTLDASTATGVLTADISNAVMSVDAVFTGGLASDRFYAAGLDEVVFVPATSLTGAYYANTAVAVNVLAEINGGSDDAIDTLTVQSNAGGTIDLADGSAGMDVLNVVAGQYAGASAFAIDLADGGFGYVTFNNQSTGIAMINTLTNLDVGNQFLSIRSTGLNTVGDPATVQMAAVNIQFTQAAGLVGGTLGLELGAASDDRAETDAFSHHNYTSDVSLTDNGAQGTTEVDSLNLVVNSAGASRTGSVNLSVVYDDFETLTTLSSDLAATNVVNIGWQQVAGGSDYTLGGTNALNSTTYDGSTYRGTQNVTFGSALAGQAVVKSHTITTGIANSDTVDLSYMGTNAARTPVAYAISSYLLGTSVDLGGGTGDELILSATLADPRVVTNADITYDGYFQNWNNVDTLTINNRNNLGVSGGTLSQAATTAYVGLDAYAQINNSGLNVINFNDVSGELAVGFRFTNELTINADATGTGALQQGTKWTTLNSFSTANNTINVDASEGIASGAGNLVQYTNTGANLTNTVTLNYDSIDNSGVSITTTELLVQNSGSVDVVDFDGDLGQSVVAATGTIVVTTADTWTAANQTTTYDFSGIINSTGGSGPGNGTITFSAAAETNATGLVIIGSTDGGSATLGVNNTLTGSAGADTITSAGYSDSIVGGAGNDSITYTGNSGVATNAVIIVGDVAAGVTQVGSDTITISGMALGETATINAGAGNDTVTVGLETDTYIFSAVNLTAAGTIAAAGATVAQTVVNVGVDSITGFNFDVDGVQLSKAVFGSGLGTLAGDNIQVVTTADTLLAASTASEASFVAVQANTNGNVSLYYVDSAFLGGVVSVNNLVQAGDAILIGSFTNVTGTAAVADFSFIA